MTRPLSDLSFLFYFSCGFGYFLFYFVVSFLVGLWCIYFLSLFFFPPVFGFTCVVFAVSSPVCLISPLFSCQVIMLCYATLVILEPLCLSVSPHLGLDGLSVCFPSFLYLYSFCCLLFVRPGLFLDFHPPDFTSYRNPIHDVVPINHLHAETLVNKLQLWGCRDMLSVIQLAVW